jgi:hypothetical protein
MGRWVKQVTPPSLPKSKQLNCEDRIQAAISGVTQGIYRSYRAAAAAQGVRFETRSHSARSNRTGQGAPQAGPSRIPAPPNFSGPYYAGNTPYTGFPFPGPAIGPSSSRFPYPQAPHPPIPEIPDFYQYHSDLTHFPHYTSNPHFCRRYISI